MKKRKISHTSKGIPCMHGNISEIPGDTAGIYAFWSRTKNRCVYVGESMNIRKRLIQHLGGSHNPHLNTWIKYYRLDIEICYAKIQNPSKKFLQRVERRLINRWDPQANQTSGGELAA